MGSVWAAHHELIGRDVAIKVTGEKLSKRRETRERFLNEARAVGRLRHANIIDVMDVGQLPDGLLYIVFELLDGRSLEEQLQKKGRLPTGDAATILIDVCRGLEAAHAGGIVHRDLKPANIFLHRTPGGSTVIKLLDFGISKTIDAEGVSLSVTQTGVVMGTPQYMSVEQARGRDDIDLRSDIWSAGAILYELTTGRLAFDAANYNATLDKIMHDEALPLLSSGVNEPGLQAVVSRCLSKQRGQRYQSAKEMRKALEELLPGLPVGAGGLKWQNSISTSIVRVPDSDAPPRPKDDSPHLRASHNEPTLADPVDGSNPPTLLPPRTPARASETTRPGDAPSSPPTELSLEIERTRRKKRRRIAATVGALALGAAVAIALPISGDSKTRGGSQVFPVTPGSENTSAASPPPATHEPQNADRPTSAAAQRPQPTAAVSSPAPAPGAASAHKPATSRAQIAGEPSKSKSVTRVESAGF